MNNNTKYLLGFFPSTMNFTPSQIFFLPYNIKISSTVFLSKYRGKLKNQSNSTELLKET